MIRDANRIQSARGSLNGYVDLRLRLLRGSTMPRPIPVPIRQARTAAEARQHARLELPVAEIIERYRGGESTGAIGRSLGVSAQVIRERLIEAGVERRPRGTYPRRRDAERRE
jgi:hypothetical protein